MLKLSGRKKRVTKEKRVDRCETTIRAFFKKSKDTADPPSGEVKK